MLLCPKIAASFTSSVEILHRKMAGIDPFKGFKIQAQRLIIRASIRCQLV
jgi:hypothetical protein